jgi:hypothetical protein
MSDVFRLCTAIENKTGLYVCLVGETYWRNSRPLKKKFSTREEADKYLNRFMNKYNKLYRDEK